MSRYILNWQNPLTRAWHSVGDLTINCGKYIFCYTLGARTEGFTPLDRMTDIQKRYISDSLFPIFENRLISPNRPEYQKYADWTGLGGSEKMDAFKLMTRLGGQRATDNLQVQEVPEKTSEGKYETFFFIHGLRHRSPEILNYVSQIKNDDVLFPMLDVQNPFDKDAVALRTDDPSSFIGYCPRFLAPDIGYLIKNELNTLKITVHQINHDAPLQYRVLCKVTAIWPNSWSPCCGTEQIPVPTYETENINP